MPQRPCTCNRFVQGEEYIAGVHCRLCWLYAHHPKYRVLWGGPPLEQHDPGLVERSLAFMRSLRRHLRAGFPTVSDEVYERRLSVCRGCEFFHNDRCAKCGCGLTGAVVAKLRWARESCPLTPPKWGPEEVFA